MLSLSAWLRMICLCVLELSGWWEVKYTSPRSHVTQQHWGSQVRILASCRGTTWRSASARLGSPIWLSGAFCSVSVLIVENDTYHSPRLGTLWEASCTTLGLLQLTKHQAKGIFVKALAANLCRCKRLKSIISRLCSSCFCEKKKTFCGTLSRMLEVEPSVQWIHGDHHLVARIRSVYLLNLDTSGVWAPLSARPESERSSWFASFAEANVTVFPPMSVQRNSNPDVSKVWNRDSAGEQSGSRTAWLRLFLVAFSEIGNCSCGLCGTQDSVAWWFQSLRRKAREKRKQIYRSDQEIFGQAESTVWIVFADSANICSPKWFIVYELWISNWYYDK